MLSDISQEIYGHFFFMPAFVYFMRKSCFSGWQSIVILFSNFYFIRNKRFSSKKRGFCTPSLLGVVCVYAQWRITHQLFAWRTRVYCLLPSATSECENENHRGSTWINSKFLHELFSIIIRYKVGEYCMQHKRVSA